MSEFFCKVFCSRKWLPIVAFFLMIGCSRTEYIGFNQHEQGLYPRKIIWLQIAGLSPEHHVFSKLTDSFLDKKSIFETFICQGTTWGYSPYALRSQPYLEFQRQVTGKDLFNGDCKGYREPAIWSMFAKLNNYKLAFYESGNDKKQSVIQSLGCESKYLDPMFSIVETRDPKNTQMKPYSYTDQTKYESSAIFYDEMCKENGTCSSNFYYNSMGIYKKYLSAQNKYLYILRDFKFYNLLKNKKLTEAKEYYSMLEKTLSDLIKMVDLKDTLVLVTSASAIPIEFPLEGASWKAYQEKGANVLFKNESLMSPTYAIGARAENFCGSYKTTEILERILKQNNKFKIDFDIF